ncbi:ribulose-phosphate 3-epimerase [Streptomyces sp. NPDC012623]|uniref:ribulose-phosphate 3-epimerase n=1 Tax=unclassified Streptomyces TaxID=2593676 RepID=UPI0036A0362D
MTTIAPALLGADPLALADAISDVERAPVELLHLDVMDGNFVRDISFGLNTVRAVRKRTALPLDVHLQVQGPERLLDDLADIGVETVSVHVESTQHLSICLEQLAAAGVGRGVVVNPATPLSAVEEVLDRVSQVMVMTCNPGTSTFLPATLDKIKRLRALLDGRGLPSVKIVADGGIKEARIKELAEAGADVLVAASAVFKSTHGDAAAAFAALHAAI